MSTDQSTVEYRDIQGFPGYRVGNDGSVWCCTKAIGKPTKGQRRGFTLTDRWRPLKARNKKRYTVVIGDKERYIHRLVLEAFVGPCPQGMECRHFPDPDPRNNNLSNLRWGTRSENVSDRALQGRDDRYKLTIEQALEIRMRYAAGNVRQKDLAIEFSVKQSTVSNLVRRKTWKAI